MRAFKRATSVAPLAGAWIETLHHAPASSPQESLPSRERGLKRVQQQILDTVHLSLPSRERGLKQNPL